MIAPASTFGTDNLKWSRAGMAKLADAADLKSAGAKALWGFDSPSRHQKLKVYTE